MRDAASRANRLGDVRSAGDTADDPAGPVAVETSAVSRDEDRVAVALSDGQVSCPGGTRCQRDVDGLATLAQDGERLQ